MAAAAETDWQTPFGDLRLRRFPRRDADPLRAWDAADDYVLQHLAQSGMPTTAWIINDGSGALSTALSASCEVTMSSDSWLAHEATRCNLQDNGRSSERVRLLPGLEEPASPVDLLLIKVPRSLALLEDQLHRARPLLHTDTVILGAGMTRDIHTSTLRLFERILGPTTTSLARRKARLIHCHFDADLAPGDSPFPSQYELEGLGRQLCSHAGVFSQTRLDNGTRALLQHIPAAVAETDIVDLACGNGVIGLVAAQRNPQARLVFVDESFGALASARSNWQQHFGGRIARFEIGDGSAPLAADSADLILCNPPFHEDRAVGDATAWRMLKDARRVLRPGGQLLLVGNRHLAYHAKLGRLFGGCEVVDSDTKYVVLRSRCRD